MTCDPLLGLIRGDSQSYLRPDPDRTPTYGAGDRFGFVDLVTAAGVVATIT